MTPDSLKQAARLAAALLVLPCCTDSHGHGHEHSAVSTPVPRAPGSDPSAEAAAGGAPADALEDQGSHEAEHAHGHEHDEVDLGVLKLGPHAVRLAQGHGPLEGGEEAALVVQLPFSDGGETQVRAWLGGAERTESFIGRGIYAPSHDDYDLHVLAPDALGADTSWWVELELPDGSRLVGSHPPLRADE